MREITNESKLPILFVDNQAAKRLCENAELHSRTKHIQRKHLFVRDRIKAGMLEVQHISSELQLADLLTKPMARPRLMVLREKVGLRVF